jgi:hypothetical protein
MKNLHIVIILLIGYLLTDCSEQKKHPSQILSNKVATITEENQKKTIDESTITDIDGNIYTVVQIGNQFWMASNLKVSTYNNAEPIKLYAGGGFLKTEETGMFVLYENNEEWEQKYGKLYNFYAVNEACLCPKGWHVPSEEEWQEMIDSGSDTLLNFQPGGSMNPRELSPFSGMGTTGCWWTSTSVGRNTAAYFNFYPKDKKNKRAGSNAGVFFSVRCIKNIKQ